MNEAAFELPAIGLVDRTVTRLDAVSEEGRAQKIVVHRSRMPEGKTLADLAAGSLREAGVRLRLHEALFTREIGVAGALAIDLGAQWRGERGYAGAGQSWARKGVSFRTGTRARPRCPCP